jgi:hypothetical protein
MSESGVFVSEMRPNASLAGSANWRLQGFCAIAPILTMTQPTYRQLLMDLLDQTSENSFVRSFSRVVPGVAIGFLVFLACCKNTNKSDGVPPCQKFVDYQTKVVDVKGLQAQVAKVDATVGAVSVKSDSRPASDEIQRLDYEQYDACTSIERVSDSATRESLRAKYAQRLIYELHSAVPEVAPADTTPKPRPPVAPVELAQPAQLGGDVGNVSDFVDDRYGAISFRVDVNGDLFGSTHNGTVTAARPVHILSEQRLNGGCQYNSSVNGNIYTWHTQCGNTAGVHYLIHLGY